MLLRIVAAGVLVAGALLTTGCAHRVATPASSPIEENEGALGRTAAAMLAKRIGCIEYEPQQRAPGVQAQGSCRIGTHRLYVQTFASVHDRGHYVQAGVGPKPTGKDIIGSKWIVHVEDASFAPTVHRQLGGTLVPAG